MKISIVVPVPEKRGDYRGFAHTLEKLVLLGYDGVELAVQNPNKINVQKVKALIASSNLEVSAIATGSAFVKEHWSFSSPAGLTRYWAVKRIKDQISFASLLGCSTKVIIGLIRGYTCYRSNFPRLVHLPKAERDDYFLQAKRHVIECLRECDNFARLHGITLVLEAINRYEADFLNRLEETAEFLKENELGAIKVHADTFHMHIEEGKSIPQSLRRVGKQLGYVHVADSNRIPPGQGRFDFAEFIEVLREIGYEGWLSAEVMPYRPDSMPSFDLIARDTIWYLRNLGV